MPKPGQPVGTSRVTCDSGLPPHTTPPSSLFQARQSAFDRSDCGNGPDEEGNWPCDPQVVFGDNWAVCSVCGREAAWGAKPDCPCGNPSVTLYDWRWCAECGPYVAEESR